MTITGFGRTATLYCPGRFLGRLLVAAVLLVGLAAGLARAEDRAASADDLGDLARVLQVHDLIEVMAAEGAAYGAALEEELFSGRGGAKWAGQVARIYDPATMEKAFLDSLATALDGADPGPMLTFFDTPTGQYVVSMEITVREAMLDETTDEASKQNLQDLRDVGAPLLNHLRAFIEANDLIDSNVIGAMNANYAFYSGLVEGGALPDEITERDILDDVWAEEPDIRVETENWVYRYLALAYQPLPEGVLSDYTAFSRTAGGQALNAALLTAFDRLFVDISRNLGRAAAFYIVGQDL